MRKYVLVILIAFLAGISILIAVDVTFNTDSEQGAVSDNKTNTATVKIADLSFETVAEGSDSAYAVYEDELIVISNYEQWKQTWQQINANKLPAREPPSVDFTRDILLILFLSPSGGATNVEITKVQLFNDGADRLSLQARKISPKSECSMIQVVNYPFHIIKLNYHDTKETPSLHIESRQTDCN